MMGIMIGSFAAVPLKEIPANNGLWVLLYNNNKIMIILLNLYIELTDKLQ